MPDESVAGADDAPKLLAVLRADVEEEVVVVERLAVLAALPLLLPPRDDPRHRAFPGENVDALAQHRVRVEAAERPQRREAVVAEVRDDRADLVDVADERERRPSGPAGHAYPRAAEDVGRDLADGGGRLPPDGGGGPLLPRGTGRRQEAFEQVGERHSGGTLPARSGPTPR